MEFSTNQINFFDNLVNGSKSIVLEAVAGSGKTTTIVEGANRLKSNSILFLAFNKSIVQELTGRLPNTVNCMTFNSLGHRAWMRFTGNRSIQLDSNKIRNIIKDRFTETDGKIYSQFVSKMVSLAKSHGLTPNDNDSVWDDLRKHHDVSFEDDDDSEREGFKFDRAYDLCRKTLNLSINISERIIDFDDQLYMPWYRGITFQQYDYVFIDEAQDTNHIQKELLSRIVRQKLIAVGDSCQSIYGFRGADSSSMEMIRNLFNADKMPLSTSYRCGKNIVALAQNYNPLIQSYEQAQDGIVDNIKQYDHTVFDIESAILCRFNAPLVNIAYRLIGAGRAINFMGRDIGKGLKALIAKMNCSNLEELAIKIDEWSNSESEKFMNRNEEAKAESVKDRANCILVLIDNLSDVRTPIAVVSANTLGAQKLAHILSEYEATVCKIPAGGMSWESRVLGFFSEHCHPDGDKIALQIAALSFL